MQDSARPPAQPLPLLDQDLVARLKRERAEFLAKWTGLLPEIVAAVN